MFRLRKFMQAAPLRFLPAVFFLAGCGSDGVSQMPDETLEINFDFSDGQSAWVGGFADYPAGEESFYRLEAVWEALPAPLSTLNGFRLSGDNRSDDLFMFIKRQYTGLPASRTYEVSFEITLATNEASGCVGIGGAPGEAVHVKAGAAFAEPEALLQSDGSLRMNIDKGNQATGGNEAVVVGNLAGAKTDCNDQSYEQKTLADSNVPLFATTGSDGTLWIILGTDSGYEGMTSFYFLSGTIKLRPV